VHFCSDAVDIATRIQFRELIVRVPAGAFGRTKHPWTGTAFQAAPFHMRPMIGGTGQPSGGFVE
jgi:hypothetical protein